MAPKPPKIYWKGCGIGILGMIGRNTPSENDRAIGIYTQSAYMSNDTSRLDPSMFNVCKLSNGRVIAAGGSVLAHVEGKNPYKYSNGIDRSSSSTFESSDIDLYIRANSAEESWNITSKLIEYLKPVGVVVRTKFTISFYSEVTSPAACEGIHLTYAENGKSFIKVQIIDRVIPRTDSITDDISHLFETYDLDCCKWACDGEHFYTTERAKEAYATRICHVPWQKITDSIITRMARYFSRCYDFEIEGYDSRHVVFPQAIQKIVEIIRTRKVPRDLPGSNYSKAGQLTHVGGNPMFKMLKMHGQFGAEPYMICGTKEDVPHMALQGTQPVSYMIDWGMETMNKMAETVLWLVSPQHEEERSKVRGYCVDTVEEWKKIMAQKVRFAPMFTHPIEFIGLSAEVFQKYWVPVAVSREYNVV